MSIWTPRPKTARCKCVRQPRPLALRVTVSTVSADEIRRAVEVAAVMAQQRIARAMWPGGDA